MRNFQDTFVKRKRSFISAFWICMAVPLTILYCIYMHVQMCICICVYIYICIKGTMFYIRYIHRERDRDRQTDRQTDSLYYRAICKSIKLVSAIFYQNFFHQMIALQKLWKMFFISSKKLFSFSRYSNFYNFSPSFPHFPDSKEHTEVE